MIVFFKCIMLWVRTGVVFWSRLWGASVSDCRAGHHLRSDQQELGTTMRSSRGWLGGALVAGLIALGSSSAVADDTISVGPGGRVAAIVTLMEDPPVPFFGLDVHIPYDPLTLEPVPRDDGEGFKANPLPAAPPGSIVFAVPAPAPADPSTVRMVLIYALGINGPAGDLMEVLLDVVGGSIEVPVSIPFTVTSVIDGLGRELPVEDWPELYVFLPEPSGGALALTALVALAVLRGVRSRLRRVR